MDFSFIFNAPAVALTIAVSGIVILLTIMIWYLVMRNIYRVSIYAKIIDTAKRPVQDKKKKKEMSVQEQIEILKKGDPLNQTVYQYSPIYEYEYNNKNFKTPSGFYTTRQNMFKPNSIKKIYLNPHNPNKILDLKFYRGNILRAGIMGVLLIVIALVMALCFK